MRITLLTTALMMATAMAWADEPPAPEAKTEAAAQPAPATATATATEKVAANEATTAAVATEEAKAFKPPPGYRPKRINGEQVYCAKLVVLGSRFPKEDCRTESDLRELALRREEMRRDVESTRSMCASDNGACGMK